MAGNRVLEDPEPGPLVEAVALEVRLFPGPHFELAGLLERASVDSDSGKLKQKLRSALWIHDLKHLVAPVQTFPDKREHHLVFLVRAAEERAGVACTAHNRTSKMDWFSMSAHRSPRLASSCERIGSTRKRRRKQN